MTGPLQGRQAGVLLHITSLPGPFGIGEIGKHARAFIDLLKEMRLKVWQFLPTGPTGFGNSPYQALSTFAGNELLIDVGDLLAAGLLHEHEVAGLRELPRNYTDFHRLVPIKTALLDVAAKRFDDRADPQLREQCEAFIRQENDTWLRDYALFRVLKSQYNEAHWNDWPQKHAQRDSQALREFASRQAERIRTIKILQFLFYHQWLLLQDYARSSGVRLFGDLPVYVASDSADAWANRELLQLDNEGKPVAVAGVPPDYFSEDGQLWGNPLYDWDYHRGQRFDWWIQRLRSAVKMADMVRIDHFRGFESYWAIPASASSARTGEWKPGPGDALFTAARTALGNLPIVAENLGLITPAVDELRLRHQIPGMQVLQFSLVDGSFEWPGMEENCVCYTATHDNDTTFGWFNGATADNNDPGLAEHLRKNVLEKTVGRAETIHFDLIKAAFASNAMLAVAPMQDFLGLGSESRMNTPGTIEGNWRWRAQSCQFSGELTGQVATASISSGRDGRT